MAHWIEEAAIPGRDCIVNITAFIEQKELPIFTLIYLHLFIFNGFVNDGVERITKSLP